MTDQGHSRVPTKGKSTEGENILLYDNLGFLLGIVYFSRPAPSSQKITAQWLKSHRDGARARAQLGEHLPCI